MIIQFQDSFIGLPEEELQGRFVLPSIIRLLKVREICSLSIEVRDLVILACKHLHSL